MNFFKISLLIGPLCLLTVTAHAQPVIFKDADLKLGQKLIDENTGAEIGNNEKGVVVIEGPLPPGCMSTVWGDDERFVKTYFGDFKGQLVYSTFDWGIRDKDGYWFILGRTDDVINVAGHRLGTREIEEAVQAHAGIAEVAVVATVEGEAAEAPEAEPQSLDTAKEVCPRNSSSRAAGIAPVTPNGASEGPIARTRTRLGVVPPITNPAMRALPLARVARRRSRTSSRV